MFFSAEKRPAKTSTRVPRGRFELGGEIARAPLGIEGVDVDSERLAGGVR